MKISKQLWKLYLVELTACIFHKVIPNFDKSNLRVLSKMQVAYKVNGRLTCLINYSYTGELYLTVDCECLDPEIFGAKQTLVAPIVDYANGLQYLVERRMQETFADESIRYSFDNSPK